MWYQKNLLSSYLKVLIILKFQIIHLSSLTENERNNKTASKTNNKSNNRYNILGDKVHEYYNNEMDRMDEIIDIFSELTAIYERATKAAEATTQNILSPNPVSTDYTTSIENATMKISLLSGVSRNQIQPETFKKESMSSSSFTMNEDVTEIPVFFGPEKHLILKSAKHPELPESTKRDSSKKSEIPPVSTSYIPATSQKEVNKEEKTEIEVQFSPESSSTVMNGNHTFKNENNTKSTLPRLLTKPKHSNSNISKNILHNRVNKDIKRKTNKTSNNRSGDNISGSFTKSRLETNLPLKITTSRYQNDKDFNFSEPHQQLFGLKTNKKRLSNSINLTQSYKNCSEDINYELPVDEIDYRTINETNDSNDLRSDKSEVKLNCSTPDDQQFGLRNFRNILFRVIDFVKSFKNGLKVDNYKLPADIINNQTVDRTCNNLKSIEDNTELNDNFQLSINNTSVLNKTRTFYMFGSKTNSSLLTLTYFADVFYNILMN